MDPLSKKRIMIIAGEASGDLHGSNLVKAMYQRNHMLSFCGIGGQALRTAGVKILVDASELSVVGITEALPKIVSLFKGIAVAKKTLARQRPDLLILIDFPDFNLHLAATAKKLGIPVLYYISPQIWAWRPGRVKKIKALIDHMVVILPFEERFYRRHNIPVSFVGHPLLDADIIPSVAASGKIAEENPVIGFLPGSRDREITRHLPVMIEAARFLGRKIKGAKFIVSLASDVERKNIEKMVNNHNGTVKFELVAGSVQKIFKQSSIVVAASGTVTLEAAISGTPMVIIYKVSPVSYWLGKALIKVKHIGLANLIAEKEIVPELVQEAASPGNIADTVFKMLKDTAGLERVKAELLSIKDALGKPGAAERVADIAIGMI